MLKFVNLQICEICRQENVTDHVTTEQEVIKLPPCPGCGSQEFLFPLTLRQNPTEQASLVRELAANLGLIQRTDPAYFKQ